MRRRVLRPVVSPVTARVLPQWLAGARRDQVWVLVGGQGRECDSGTKSHGGAGARRYGIRVHMLLGVRARRRLGGSGLVRVQGAWRPQRSTAGG